MATSFLTQSDPAFNNALVQSMHVGAQLATETSKAQAEQALMLQRAQMERQMQVGLKQYEVENENMRSLIGKKESLVKDLVAQHKDYIDKTSEYLGSHGGELTSHARTVLQTNIQQHRFELGKTLQDFGEQNLGLRVPNPGEITNLNQADAVSALTDYTPEQTSKVKAEALKPQLETSNLLMSNSANQNAFNQSGGKFSTPQESLHSTQIQQTGNYQQGRLQLSRDRLNTKLGGGSILTPNGTPLKNPSELYEINQTQSSLPSFIDRTTTDYNNAVHGGGSTGADAWDRYLGGFAEKAPEFTKVAQFHYNNADQNVKSAITNLGLTLTSANQSKIDKDGNVAQGSLDPKTIIDNQKKIMGAYNAATDPTQKAIYANIHKGFGYGEIKGAPSYMPVPKFGGNFTNFINSPSSSSDADESDHADFRYGRDDVSNIGILAQ